MLNEQTADKMMTMKLDAMVEAWRLQQKDPHISVLSFDERMGLLVDAQWTARENHRVKRLLHDAKLRISGACLEDLDYSARRELDRAVVRQLASCKWVEERQNIIITGATGVGKSYLACALAHQACRKGFRTHYRRVPRFFEELTLAHADGTYIRLLDKLARMDVLVLDDWAMSPLREQDRKDMLEILDDRYGARCTILTSQLPVSTWHDYVGDPTLADAICDRIVHNSHRIALKGPTKRKQETKKEET